MSPASLRPARDADVAAIAALWHDAWHDAHDANVPAGLVGDRPLLYFTGRVPDLIATTTVAEDASGVAGFVTVTDDELDLLFVAARGRGTGVAADLLTHGERQLAEHYDTAWLDVVTGNDRARAFYARQGWRDTGPADDSIETSTGPAVVPQHRYEKWLQG
jgi:ribosomal protein S18 acetylase RimI-like enzyme